MNPMPFYHLSMTKISSITSDVFKRFLTSYNAQNDKFPIGENMSLFLVFLGTLVFHSFLLQVQPNFRPVLKTVIFLAVYYWKAYLMDNLAAKVSF